MVTVHGTYCLIIKRKYPSQVFFFVMNYSYIYYNTYIRSFSPYATVVRLFDISKVSAAAAFALNLIFWSTLLICLFTSGQVFQISINVFNRFSTFKCSKWFTFSNKMDLDQLSINFRSKNCSKTDLKSQKKNGIILPEIS